MRKLGDAPVIYSEEETNRTREEITKAVQNMGYMGALVEPVRQVKKKKMKLVYKVTTGKPYKVRTLKYDMQNASASQTNCFRMDITSSIKSTYPILRILSVILIW